MTFRIEWNPLALVLGQEYIEELGDVIKTATTLAGCDKGQSLKAICRERR